MKGIYIGSGIGVRQSILGNADAAADGTSATSVNGAANFFIKFNLSGANAPKATTDFKSQPWHLAKYTAASVAASSGTATPWFNGRGSGTAQATGLADGEANGFGTFSSIAGANVSGETASKNEVVGSANGSATIICVIKTIADVRAVTAGFSTTSATSRTLFINSIKTSALNKFSQITTAQTKRTNITSNITKSKNITEAA